MANQVYVALRVLTAYDPVIVIEVDSYHMNVDAARDLSNQLARAADEAEAKAGNQPQLP